LIVERTDFISVPVRDMERSKRFYAETLGLPSPNRDGGWPEFETGNVSLYLMDPTNVGQEFAGPHTAHIALRVTSVRDARAELEGKGVEFEGDILDTGVCHMAHFTDPDGNVMMLHRNYASADGAQ
jgi:catechol 2,3-dioxygenase-like lactoylglutathione lyase family enzyme